METRANYLLIGSFTLAGFLGMLGFVLWFVSVELDRQFDYYDVVFSSVSGLSNASEVRFAGIPVGQVVDVGLDLEQTGLVRVRIEIQAGTPISTSSFATIESLGVTGLSYVAISAGDVGAPLLSEVSPDPVPDIPSRRSPIQSVVEDAPQILEEILDVSRSLAELVGPDTQERISAILANVEASSGSIDRTLEDFSDVTETVAIAAEDIATFTSRLQTISNQATVTLESADSTMQQVRDLAARTEQTLDTGDAALDAARETFAAASGFVEGDLPRLTQAAEQTLASVRAEAESVGDRATAALDELREVGRVANERLLQTEETILAANTALEDLSEASTSVSEAASSLDALISGDGAGAVADARTLITDANAVVTAALTVAETDLPEILDEIRQATTTASQVVEDVGADLSAAASRTDTITADLSETLATVSDTFARANGTIARLDTALETGESALGAAEEAFTSADRVLNDDIGDMTGALRETLSTLDTAIASVTADVPVMTEELRLAAERANATFARVEAAAAQITPALGTFSSEGLPQFTRFAREARALVASLDGLTRQIQRDPARFFLGREDPSFRR